MNIIHIKYLKNLLAMCSDSYDFGKFETNNSRKGLSMNINTFSLFYDSIRVTTIAGRFRYKYIEQKLRYELRLHCVYVQGHTLLICSNFLYSQILKLVTEVMVDMLIMKMLKWLPGKAIASVHSKN